MTWYPDWFVILMETLDYLPFSKARVGAEPQKSYNVLSSNASLPGLGQIIPSIDSGIIRLVLGIVPKLF